MKKPAFKIFITLFVAGLFLTPHAVYSNQQCTSDINDSTPVEILLAGENWDEKNSPIKPIKMRVPKNFLIESDNWKGGHQSRIKIGLDLSDNSPSCIKHSNTLPYGDGTYTEASYPNLLSEDVVFITVTPGRLLAGYDPQKFDGINKSIKSDLKNYTVLLNKNDQGFSVYRRPPNQIPEQFRLLLVPNEGLLSQAVKVNGYSIVPEGDYKMKSLQAYTYDKNMQVFIEYLSHASWLGKFPNLDANIRKVVNQFIVNE